MMMGAGVWCSAKTVSLLNWLGATPNSNAALGKTVVGALQTKQSQQAAEGETGWPFASTVIVLAPPSAQITISIRPDPIGAAAFSAPL
jgi:hypothetical protein